jgi:arylsulfatase A-like enzyme
VTVGETTASTHQVTGATMPRSVVVVLLDSLNRHMLGAYGGDEFDTPNLNRVAARSVRFDRHYTGSLPCMPARHDLLCGSLDFLWRPWGSIEVWEEPITRRLHSAGVTTMLVSDHPHLFETGGENYHCDFTAWEYVRGHEDDPWRTMADTSWVGSPAVPADASWLARHYDTSRTWFRTDDDFPGARTMDEAAAWLERAAGHHDRFMLFIDEFDPHEPFDVPEPWMSRYDPDWDGPKVIWPPYTADAVAAGHIDERTARHIRANYGAKLSFIDDRLGRVLDVLDRHALWDDTAVIVCTDHGHYLGERDIFGKPGVPVFEPLGHIPLMIAWPGVSAGSSSALTTTVDIFATLCHVFDVDVEQATHGHSLVPLITGETAAIRDRLLTGVWGRTVQMVSGSMKYVRAPRDGNRPLSMWSNRWSTMPIHAFPNVRLPRPDRRATLEYMPGSDVPVIRQPFGIGDPVPYWAQTSGDDPDLVFDVVDDPAETHDITDVHVGRRLAAELRDELAAIGAPDDQLARLGL